MLTVVRGNAQRMYRSGVLVSVNATGHLVIVNPDLGTYALISPGLWDEAFVGDGPAEAPHPIPPPAVQ